MNPFTPLWYVLILLFILFGMAIHSWLRDKDRDFQRKVLTGLAIGLWVLSTTFTFDRIHDPRFDFQLTQNLPLHFCSLVTIMLMPAFILPEHNRWTRWYRAILFYPGLAAAFLAVAAPAVEYLDQPLFAMNTLFYFVHLGNVVLCALLASLGFYHPTIRDIFRSLIGFFVIAVAIFPLTLLIRAFIDGQANYFFEFDPAGSAIFDMLWAVIPIPLLYQVPLLVLIIPVLLLEYGIYRLAKKYHVGFHRRAGYLAR